VMVMITPRAKAPMDECIIALEKQRFDVHQRRYSHGI